MEVWLAVTLCAAAFVVGAAIFGFVIAIIAILSAASVATYFGVTESARKSNVGSTASQIGQLVYLASIDGDDSDNVSTKDSKLT